MLFYLSNHVLLQERQFRAEQALAIKSISHLLLQAPHLHPDELQLAAGLGTSKQGC